MKMGVAPSLFLGFLLFLLVFSDSARDIFIPSTAGDAEGTRPLTNAAHILHELEKFSKSVVPSSEGSPTDFCSSCLEISRKAQKILSDPTLFDEIAGIFCRGTGNSDLEAQCTKMVEMYKTEAVLFLQQVAVEEKFCNNSGLCPDNAQEGSLQQTSSDSELLTPIEHLNEMLSKLQKILPTEEMARFLNSGNPLTDRLELEWNRTCNTCRNVFDRIRNELEDPDKQLKIITSLLRACETEVFVYRCKKVVFAYGPLVISNLEKIVSMDLCRMVHICVDPKNQTNPTNGHYSARRLPGATAMLDFM